MATQATHVPFTPQAKAQIDKIIADAVEKGVAAKTKPILDKIEPMAQALEKAAKTAASRTGRSPQEIMSMCAGENGVPAYMLASDGQMIPFVNKSHIRRTKSIGYGRDPQSKQKNWRGDYTFGDFLIHNYRLNTMGVSRAGESLDHLSKMGATNNRMDSDGRVIKTALAESSGITGGFGVPPQFLEELQRLKVENMILGARARRLPMSTATLTIPSLDHTTVYSAGITPFLAGVQGTWASEAGLINESEPQLRQTELRANQLSLFMVVSNVLMQDQVINLDSLVTELLTEADGWYKDLAFIRGNGAGQPLGVQNCNAAIQVTRQSSGHVTFQDIRQMFAKVIYNNFEDMVWVGSPTIVDDLLGMNDTSGAAPSSDLGRGRLIWQPFNEGAQEGINNFTGKQRFGSLLGFDLYLSEKMFAKGATGDLMLIDAAKYLIGERMDHQIEASPHVLFKNYQTIIRCVSREDGQPWLNNPVTLADGSSTQSPFVILH